MRKPFENRHVLDRIPDFYERLRGSYDAKFFEQEALGEYLNVQAGVVYPGFQRARNLGKWRSTERCRCSGHWTLTWIR